MVVETQAVPLGWARPWAIARPFNRPMPRAGAWYPVLGEAGPDRLILEIRGRRVAVRRHLFEVREERPRTFTVVVRTKDDPNPAHGTAQDVGRQYAVCPACGTRASLAGAPKVIRCAGCGHIGEVAYWETG